MILVVEDEPVTRVLLRAQVARLGYDVADVGSGEAAVAFAGASDVDLVLMDCQLPGIDGLEATRRLRAAEQGTGRRVPIVAMTASIVPGERRQWDDAGMDGVCAKPVSLATLRSIADRWLGPPPGNVPAR